MAKEEQPQVAVAETEPALTASSAEPAAAAADASAPSTSAAAPPPAGDKPAAGGDEEEDDDDEEKETCGFCLYMMGGGCKKPFKAWSKCVDRERELSDDYALHCQEETMALRECMLKNREYYQPLLDEEDAAYAERQAEEAEVDEHARERAAQEAAARAKESEGASKGA